MNNKCIIYKEIPFYRLLQDNFNSFKYTGMYIDEDSEKKYIFKSDDDLYYYISMKKEDLKILLEFYKSQLSKQHLDYIVKQLSLVDMSLFLSKYGEKLKFDNTFFNINNKKSNVKSMIVNNKKNIQRSNNKVKMLV